MRKKNEINENIFCNVDDTSAALKSLLPQNKTRNDYWVVWILGSNVLPADPGFRFPQRCTAAKILLVFEGLPVIPAALMAWRTWAEGKGAFDVKVAFYEKNTYSSMLVQFLKDCLGDRLKPQPEKEPCKIKKGQLVRLSDGKAQKGEPSLLTLMFGKTGELLSYLDWIRFRFNKANNIPKTDIGKYLASISKCLQNPHSEKSQDIPSLGVEEGVDSIPRILLIGETGVGKTLFAKYLSGDGSFIRISIPEYLEKEDMFEYDMFGYTCHAYNNADPNGSRGVLLNNVGGVIFLDEIGEASPKIQAKLLAFLDDYKVRPRDWTGKGFYCPVLIVGATNQPIETDKEKYRNDLVQRFTDRQTIPPLRERKESFHLLLDCLLQNEGINIDGKIEEIGKDAYNLLFQKDYKEGNFRELENLVRVACRKARIDGRTYIVRQDFE